MQSTEIIRNKIIPSPQARADYVRTPFVPDTEETRFRLNDDSIALVKATPYSFGFDGFGEAVYYRTYSRRDDGKQENWHDTILRVVNGVFSIRKNWYYAHCLPWDEGYWQYQALRLAESAVKMEWLPPGRGLYAMGTEYAYQRGGLCLYNCAATKIGVKSIAADFGWMMDALMSGCGVGFEALPLDYKMQTPSGSPVYYVVPDTREGWVESEELLIKSYLGGRPIEFVYDEVRPAGAILKGIGGVSAGSEPLRRLHDHTRQTCERYLRKEFGGTRLVADIGNGIGVCVVMGNIRRSAEIMIGSVHDQEFLDLKNLEKNPDRAGYYWMSNNSVRLVRDEDFEKLPVIAGRIRDNGEPGVINLRAVRKFARFGREKNDAADLFNPCTEIPLENKEVCNLSEVFPTKCKSEAAIYAAMENATLYSSTVTLLPTHRAETNTIVARNRRIGVSCSGLAEWLDDIEAAKMTRVLRTGYKKVQETNRRLALDAGIPESIRLTTVKPSGSISQLAGVTPGIHNPTFKYAIRRMRIAKNSVIAKVLSDAGYFIEPDFSEPLNTLVVEFPIDQGRARKATEVSVWEQAAQLCTMQREWADNAVSVTLYFNPETEADQLEHLLAQIAPMVKSLSMLPHTPEGVYKQAPYSEISQEEYLRRKALLKPIDWSLYRGDGEDEKYCDNGTCKVEKKTQ